MRTSALFDEKTSDFSKFVVCPYRYVICLHFVSVFCDINQIPV